MKFSIRISILSLFSMLLVIVGAAIIFTNYYVFHKNMHTTAVNSSTQTSSRIQSIISNYLQPLNERVLFSSQLTQDGVIRPSATPGFKKYLLNIMKDSSNLSAMEWADTKGSLYMIERTGADTYAFITIDRAAKPLQQTEEAINSHGETIGAIKKSPVDFDPRVRPWYQQAKFKQSLIWAVYPLKMFSNHNEELGLTVANPVFVNGKLLGVFGTDIRLATLSNYVSHLPITANTIVFICDEQQRLLTSFSLNTPLAISYNMPKIKNLNNPWAEESFIQYQKTKAPVFSYFYQHKEYIASYSNIDNKTAFKWYSAIVTPVSDIIGPLQQNTLIAIILAIFILIIGMILVAIFSGNISKPIKRLAKEAMNIQNLKLESEGIIPSHIAEITDMNYAFEVMKKSLRSFGHYLPFNIVKNLVVKGEIAQVGGEVEQLTFLFADIENFSTISEKMEPKKVMMYLSEYFEAMSQVLLEHHGSLDKYIGDELMAFWGAPIKDEQQALHACQCAINMQKKLLELHDIWKAKGDPVFNIRIGINTGKAVIGSVGSSDRLNYTALGDSVNLASRLQDLCKLYGVYTLVSENTVHIIKDHFAFRLLDYVTVKGKTQGVFVYELIGGLEKRDYALNQYNEFFAQAFIPYRKGLWDDAIQAFQKLAEMFPDNPVPKLFIERCAILAKNPPKIWEGSWIMKRK